MGSGQLDEDDDIRSPTPNPTRSPLPNTDRLRTILSNPTGAATSSLAPFANPTSVGFASGGYTRSTGVRQPPPPIPPRRQPLLMNGATFNKMRSASLSGTISPSIRPGIGRQLPNPAHLPGTAMRRHLPPPIPPHRQSNHLPLKQSPQIISNPLSATVDSYASNSLMNGHCSPRLLPQPNLTNRRLITNPFLNECESQPLHAYVRSPPGISCVGGSLSQSDSGFDLVDEAPMQRSVSFETPLISAAESNQRRIVLYPGRCGSSLDSQSPLYLNLSRPNVSNVFANRMGINGTVSQPDSAVTSPEHVIRSACSDDDILHEQERFRKMDHKQLVDYIENLKESCA